MPLLFQERKKRRSAGYDDYNDDGGGDYDCTCEDGPKRDNNSADQDPIELGQAILGGKAIFFPTDYHLLQLYIDTELVRTIVIKQKPTWTCSLPMPQYLATRKAAKEQIKEAIPTL